MRVKKRQPQRPPPTPSPEKAERTDTPSPSANVSPPSPSIVPTVTLPPLEKINFDNRIKRKNVLALNEKVAAIREYDKMPVYKHVGRMFHCSPDQIKRTVLQRENILKAWEQRTRRCQDAKTLEMKVVRVSMLGKAVYDWIRRMMYYKDFIITDGLIQKMALQFKSAMGLQNFFPHQEWCDKFRQTYNIEHNDTKDLKIGYVQGHSVQIKDIIKDVLTECTPDTPSKADADVDDGDNCDDANDKSDTDAENKDEDVDVDGDGHESLVDDEDDGVQDVKPELGINSKLPIVQPPQLQTHMLPPLQPLRHLLALPIKTNGPPGTTQKVLVATPISAPGQLRKDSMPMTMTIIPLATLAQSVQQQQQQPQQKTATPEKPQQQTVPPPILDIKKEIKEEPKDAEDVAEPEQPAPVYIKQEVISEDEETPTTSTTPTLESVPLTPPDIDSFVENVQTLPIAEQEQAEDEVKKIENQSDLNTKELISTNKRGGAIGTRSAVKTTMAAQAMSPAAEPMPAITLRVLTPPVLKRAPTAPPLTADASVGTSSSTTTTATTTTMTSTTTRNAKKRKLNSRSNRNNNNKRPAPVPPAIGSCSEARRYLKLLEDFALYKENFRLIALITRADELLRELDEDRDQDVDID